MSRKLALRMVVTFHIRSVDVVSSNDLRAI